MDTQNIDDKGARHLQIGDPGGWNLLAGIGLVGIFMMMGLWTAVKAATLGGTQMELLGGLALAAFAMIPFMAALGSVGGLELCVQQDGAYRLRIKRWSSGREFTGTRDQVQAVLVHEFKTEDGDAYGVRLAFTNAPTLWVATFDDKAQAAALGADLAGRFGQPLPKVQATSEHYSVAGLHGWLTLPATR